MTKPLEFTWPEKQRENKLKKKKKKENSLRDHSDNNRRFTIRIIGVPEGKEKM